MSDNDQIFSLLSDIRETQIKQAEQQGHMAEKIEALAGEHGRVTALEKQATRNFWLATAVGPALGIAHAIARKLGVNI